MNKIKYFVLLLTFVVSQPLNAANNLPIYGMWIGQSYTGDDLKLIIEPNTLEFYWTMRSGIGMALPERDKKHNDITFFKSTDNNHTNEFIALKPGENDLTRFVLQPNGELVIYEAGSRKAKARLTRSAQ